MTARLIYVMDPMCSWCWGFAPVAAALIAQAAEAGVSTRLVPGGLRTGGSALDGSTRKYILEHWQAVAEATGQPFRFDGAMPDGFVYDTKPACRALVTARELDAERVWPLLGLIQRAFYEQGVDVTRARNWSNWPNRPASTASVSPSSSPAMTFAPPPARTSAGCRTLASPASRPCWLSATASWHC